MDKVFKILFVTNRKDTLVCWILVFGLLEILCVSIPQRQPIVKQKLLPQLSESLTPVYQSQKLGNQILADVVSEQVLDASGQASI